MLRPPNPATSRMEAGPASTCMHAPEVASHIQTVPSLEPQRSTLPLECQVSHSTSEGPSSERFRAPVSPSQTYAAEGRKRAPAVKEKYGCPPNSNEGRVRSMLAGCQHTFYLLEFNTGGSARGLTLTRPSSPPVAQRRPSQEKATAATLSVCPASVATAVGATVKPAPAPAWALTGGSAAASTDTEEAAASLSPSGTTARCQRVATSSPPPVRMRT